MKKEYQYPQVKTEQIGSLDDLTKLSVQDPDGNSLDVDEDGDDPANGLAKPFSLWDDDEE